MQTLWIVLFLNPHLNFIKVVISPRDNVLKWMAVPFSVHVAVNFYPFELLNIKN